MLENKTSPFIIVTSPVSTVKVPTVAAPLISIERTSVSTPPATVTLSIDTSLLVDEITTLPFPEVIPKSAPLAPI